MDKSESCFPLWNSRDGQLRLTNASNTAFSLYWGRSERAGSFRAETCMFLAAKANGAGDLFVQRAGDLLGIDLNPMHDLRPGNLVAVMPGCWEAIVSDSEYTTTRRRR